MRLHLLTISFLLLLISANHTFLYSATLGTTHEHSSSHSGKYAQESNETNDEALRQQIKKHFGQYMNRPFWRLVHEPHSEVYSIPETYEEEFIQFNETSITYRNKKCKILSILSRTDTREKHLMLDVNGKALLLRISFHSDNSSIGFWHIYDKEGNALQQLMGDMFFFTDSKFFKVDRENYTTNNKKIIYRSPIFFKSLKEVKELGMKDGAQRLQNITAYINFKYGDKTTIHQSIKHDFNKDGVIDQILLISPRNSNMYSSFMKYTSSANNFKLLYFESVGTNIYEVKVETNFEFQHKGEYYDFTPILSEKSISFEINNKLKHETRIYTWEWDSEKKDWLPKGIETNIPKFQDLLYEQRRLKPLSRLYVFRPFYYYDNRIELEDIDF